MSDCAICYQPISLDNEAYVGSCYHRFCLSCISKWTEQQRRHPVDEGAGGAGGPDYRCPLCKASYSYILYDCVLNSFRVQYVDEAAKRRGVAAAVGGGMQLSAAHRRRRALYVKQRSEGAAGPPPAQGAPDGRTIASAVAWPEVLAFARRELQALLLQEDVELILQHVLGVLRGLLGAASVADGGGRAAGGGHRSGPQAKRARSSAPLAPSRQGFEAAVAAETASFVGQDSEAFARHLYSFLASGLSVRAHDLAVFGPPEPVVLGAGEGGGIAAPSGHGAQHRTEAAGRRPAGEPGAQAVVDLVSDTDSGDDFAGSDDD